MASKYYKINKNSKTITIDRSVKPTVADKEEIQLYIAGGYILRHKSEKRAAAARERVKANGGKIGKKKATEETKAE